MYPTKFINIKYCVANNNNKLDLQGRERIFDSGLRRQDPNSKLTMVCVPELRNIFYV